MRNLKTPERNPYPPDLRIEVKGRSVSDFSIELTPNEYGKFQEAEKAENGYRLAVVVNALKDPKLFICYHDGKNWSIEGDKKHTLDPDPRLGASIKLKRK